MNKEEWVNVKGYEELYKISSYGRIKAKRKVVYGIIDNEKQPLYVKAERMLTPFDNGNGYLSISLFKDQKLKNYYIHRLVAEHFIENKNNYPQVNHIDYDRKNNKVSNLEWVTVVENIRHSIPNKPRRVAYKTNSGHRYITLKGNRFRVCIGKPRLDKCFSTLEEAITFRDNFLALEGYSVNE